jgi:4-hydroxy 2-oxovalerate aldolase
MVRRRAVNPVLKQKVQEGRHNRIHLVERNNCFAVGFANSSRKLLYKNFRIELGQIIRIWRNLVLMSETQRKKVTILDCTLRDGGYFTNWEFDKKLAFSLIGSLNKAGVDIIEVGYKSPASHKISGFEGLFRFCTESQLQALRQLKQAEYSFMIDAKEFLKGSSVDRSALAETIPPRDESLFRWVRVATYYPNIGGCAGLVPALRDLGYNVTLNLMGISLLSEEELQKAMTVVSGLPAEVFYFSDSFGDLVPADISGCISLIRRYFKGKIGIHTHDSNGLAFANTIEAMRLGIDFIDATVLGMGRGAGNLRTEQILLYLYFKENYNHLNPSELLEVIDSYFIPLQKKHAWGWDYTYMLSALQNIHPTYCMNLRAGNQYTIEQVSSILNGIEPSKRSTFDEKALLSAIDVAVNKPLKQDGPLSEIPRYAPVAGDRFLVIATGPGSSQYKEEIREFIRQHQPFVIECNPRDDSFANVAEKYQSAVLNWARLSKMLFAPDPPRNLVITGISSLPELCQGRMNILSYPCHVRKDEVAIGREGLTLPAYVVGMYAVGLAILSDPSVIYLAGFDGYQNGDNPKQREMLTFWEKLKTGAEIISLTPTTYPITVAPVFRLIK